MRSTRIGCLKGGVKEIKTHAWFQTVDWDAVVSKKDTPPIRPKVSVRTCTSLTFDNFTCISYLNKVIEFPQSNNNLTLPQSPIYQSSITRKQSAHVSRFQLFHL